MHCRICAILAIPELGIKKGIVTDVPAETLSLFNERLQQIHMGELLGPVCALRQWGKELQGTSAIFFIDNMGVLCNIVNGSSRQLDAGSLTFALHVRLASLNLACWWEWVQSESNCSDGGSRVGITCPVARHLGIQLVHIPFPSLPANFTSLRPHEWQHFWEQQQ